MAAYNQKLEDALIAAHEAGDVEGAQIIADELKKWQPKAQKQPDPSLLQQAGAVARDIPRQLGLAARYGAQGLASTAGIVTDPLAYLANQALGTELQPLRSATEGLLTSAGLPSPQTPTERTVGTASELLAGTGGMIRGAAGLAQKAPGLIPLTQRPGLQAASAIGSGLAGGEAREMGASPAVQGAASLAGGLGLPVTTSMLQSGANKVRSMINPVMQQPTGNPALDIAKAQGYTVPPTMANPSTANRLLEGFAGKLTTGQASSSKNQEITNNLVKRDLGLPKDIPLTRDTLNLLRRDAGESYNVIRGTGTVTTDDAFADALNNITKKYQGAAKDFPDLAKNEAVDIVNSIKVSQFDSDSAIDAISVLRSNADDAFAKGNKSSGKAYREAAGALEDLLGRHLKASGAPDDIVRDYQNARTTIAKTYSVEDALNPVTGNIIASKLNKQLLKGKPLTGGMRDIATFAGAYPTAAREITSSMPGLSPLDYATGGLAAAATQNPALLAATVSRPLVRGAILSRPYQNMMLTPGQQVAPSLMLPGALQGGLLLSPEQERNNY
jgi:hypothetical protein